MASERSPAGGKQPSANSNNNHPFSFQFQRRNERLDWRKIASLDLDKIIQDGDTGGELLEFITPVLFCRAESEFDPIRVDPAFIRVFKICQLIGEYLKSSGERDAEKLQIISQESTQAAEAKRKMTQELGSLRESLTNTKKELKKTKEILASTQTQLLGSDNLDEVDQCPYCTKYFLSPSLLLAHLHRRHQGLPIPASLQAQNIASNLMFPIHNVLPQCSSSSTGIFSPKKVADCGGQTGLHLGGSPTVYAFTLNPDGALVSQKNADHNQNNHQNHDNHKENQNTIDVSGIPDLRQGVADRGFLTEIKLCFSTTSAMSTSVISPASSGILKPVIEDSKIAEIMATSAKTKTGAESNMKENKEMSPESGNKSENPDEPGTLIPGQEEETGSALKDEEIENHDKENKPSLNKQVHQSVTLTSSPEKRIQSDNLEKVKVVQVEEKGVQVEDDEILMVYSRERNEATSFSSTNKLSPPPPITCKSIGVQTIEDIDSRRRDSRDYTDERLRSSSIPNKSPIPIIPPVPIVSQPQPSPTKNQGQQTEEYKPVHIPPPPQLLNNYDQDSDEVSAYTISTSAEEYINGILHTDDSGGDSRRDTVPRNPIPNPKLSRADGESLLTDDQDDDDDEYIVIEDEDSDSDGERRTKKPEIRQGDPFLAKKSPQKINTLTNARSKLSPKAAKSPKKKYVFDAIQGKLIDACETKSQLDLVRDRIVLDELDARMENLGLDPAASSLGIEEMGRALQHLKQERRMTNESDGERFEAELNSLRKNVKYEVNKEFLAQNLEKVSARQRKVEPSRFTSMLSKVKKSGTTWRQKVATAIKRRKESNLTKPANDPEIKTTFFSKWGRKKQANKEENDGKHPNHSHHQHEAGEMTDSSDDDDESSSSDVLNHPYMTRSRPILRQQQDKDKDGRNPRKRSRSERSESRDWASVSEDENSEDEENENIDKKVGMRPNVIFHSSPTPASAASTAKTRQKQNPYQYQPPISPISPTVRRQKEKQQQQQKQHRENEEQDLKPKPKPRKDKAPLPPEPNNSQHSVVANSVWGSSTALHGNVMAELKNKIHSGSGSGMNAAKSTVFSGYQQQAKFGSTTFQVLQDLDDSMSSTVSSVYTGKGGANNKKTTASAVAEIMGMNSLERFSSRTLEEKKGGKSSGRNSWDDSSDYYTK